MPHKRKKGGVRKDKKVAKMREAIEMRHELSDQKPDRPRTDQHDIVNYKPGSARDTARHQPPPPR